MNSLSEYNGPAPAGFDDAAASQQSEDTVNPAKLVLDRMQNHWLHATLLGAVLAGVLAPLAYFLAPVKYVAQGLVKVQNRLTTLIADTPETKGLDDFGAVLSEAALQIGTGRLLESVANVALGQAPLPETPPAGARNREAEQQIVAGLFAKSGERSGVVVLGGDLSADPDLRGSKLVIVSYESSDRAVPAPVVNMVLDQYLKLYGPDSETAFTQTIQRLRTERDDVSKRISAKTIEIQAELRNTPYGTPDIEVVFAGMVKQLQDIDAELGTAKADKARLEERFSASGQTGEPSDQMVLEPNMNEVESDPEVAKARGDLDRLLAEEEGLARRYPASHSARRLHLSRIENAREAYLVARAAVASRMRTQFGGDGTYGAVKGRILELEARRKKTRDEVDRLSGIKSKLEELGREREGLQEQYNELSDSMNDRERESESIRRGRVEISAWAEAPMRPSSDKRIQLAVVGGLGGFGLAFLAFFIRGTLDPRAYRESQLQADAKLRPLGVVPDMSDAASDDEARQLASSCVHRLRNKIESKRAIGGSYAIMVTSCFQGDGKTTVAVALALSYAEAGHSTVLVDCDFIGRALSHQFASLSLEGVRESLRQGSIGDRVRKVGTNLSLLPVGFDRAFSANNVQTGTLRRLVNALKDRFEIVIIDAGPMTASVEAIPVASSCDGAVLTIRRGRSRARLGESIKDIRETGCDYLGLVLNYADREDCIRYGSVSKMSAEVARALDGQFAPAAPHPLIGPSVGDVQDDSKTSN